MGRRGIRFPNIRHRQHEVFILYENFTEGDGATLKIGAIVWVFWGTNGFGLEFELGTCNKTL